MSRIKNWLIGKETLEMAKKTDELHAETERLIARAKSNDDFLTQLNNEYKTEINRLIEEMERS